MKYYVFRHGQTDSNAKNLWVGQQTDVDLNENGFNQAELLAQDLAQNVKLDAIYSSSLIRAVHTAEVVAKAQGNIPVYPLLELREGNCGLAEKLSIREAEERWPEIVKNWHIFKKENFASRFPEGESIQEIADRVFGVFDRISREKNYPTVGISVHGGVMGMIMANLGVDHPMIPHCSYFVVEGDADNGYKVIGSLHKTH